MGRRRLLPPPSTFFTGVPTLLNTIARYMKDNAKKGTFLVLRFFDFGRRYLELIFRSIRIEEKEDAENDLAKWSLELQYMAKKKLLLTFAIDGISRNDILKLKIACICACKKGT